MPGPDPHASLQGAKAPSSAAAEDRASFELSFSPNVALVSTVRQFVQSFYEQILGDPDAVDRLGLAAHELLENAVKFSSDGVTHIRVDVLRNPEGGREVTITTRNRAEPEHLEALKKLMAELTQASDPLAHYQVLMKRSAKRTVGSGLGLGRIRAEADMELDYRIEGNLVHLQATGR